jgi:hypothetical protein
MAIHLLQNNNWRLNMFDGDDLITILEIKLESGLSLACTSGRYFITQIFPGRMWSDYPVNAFNNIA